MKILIVRMWADELNINNYNCQEIGLAKGYIDLGHECDVVLYSKNKREDSKLDYNGKHIHIYYLTALNILKNCLYEKRIFNIIKNYDFIQSAEYDQLFNIILYKKLSDKLYLYHGPYKSSYTKGYNIKCLISDIFIFFNKKYKNIKIVSKSNLATSFLKEKGFNNVLTNGVGIDASNLLTNECENDFVKEIKDTKDNNNYLLYIGKIEERRNIKFLIDVLSKLKNDVQLVMIGKGEKEYVKNIFDYAKDKNVFDRIKYKERLNQNELSSLYKNCDVFLLPTNYEIFGMVLLESMYFGLPVITTHNGGSSTLFKDEEDSIVLDLNVNSWKDSIEKIIYNEDIKKNISKNEQNAIKKYSWKSIAKRNVEFIEVNNCEKK